MTIIVLFLRSTTIRACRNELDDQSWNKKKEDCMKIVNIHEATTNLSALRAEVEKKG